MNKALKLIPFSSLFLIVPSTTALHNSIFKSGNIEKYDQNTITNSNEIGGGDFTCPINSTFFPRNGNSSTGMYRGITSINNGESDVFVITENDNAFVRMGNFNGSKTSKETRLSLYFYDNSNNCVYLVGYGIVRKYCKSLKNSYTFYNDTQHVKLFIPDDWARQQKINTYSLYK